MDNQTDQDPLEVNRSFSAPGTELAPHHEKLIRESAISPEVAQERGYFTATKKKALESLGFKGAQVRVPALVIPIYGVERSFSTYQIRPDQPRANANAKAVKYESPADGRMVLDVPRRIQPQLKDPKIPLYITEGARKADAGVSHGLCTIAVLGVWNWRGTNDVGGKTALADWHLIALNDRDVYIVFDSDVMRKPGVHGALAELRAFLGRKARVKLIYLPERADGIKVGLDDFLAAGGTVAQLQELATPELMPRPREHDGVVHAGDYYVAEGKTYWQRATREGEESVLLANFSARIVADVAVDDGLEVKREFEIEAVLGKRTSNFELLASSFTGMSWPPDKLGALASVSPGFTLRDHMRAAIQAHSAGVVQKTVYTHTGWRQIADHGWVYLHGGGAIGPSGPIPEVHVRLGSSARGMVLPEPPAGEHLAQCMRACLLILDLASPSISFPLLACAFRAALGDTDFGILLYGPTGAFKTEYAAIIQSFFGLGFTARNLPGSWLSTANMLETQAFLHKDMVFVIDDFVTAGSRQDVQRQMKDFERMLRAQGNRAGRGRLNSYASPTEGRPPRGLMFSTCEELPSRHSALARAVVLELSQGRSVELTKCQRERDEGTFAKAMSGFLKWVSPRFEVLKKDLSARTQELRKHAQEDDRHKRTASIVGDLQAAFELFLDLACECGGITAEERNDLRDRCWDALLGIASAQSGHQVVTEPTNLFLRLLNSAVSSGKAHIANMDGGAPAGCEGLGWRRTDSNSELASGFRLLPQGARVGWAEGDDLYLDMTAAYKAAQEMGSDSERIPATSITLSKRLDERGFLISTEKERGHLTVRRHIEDRRINVLHLSLGVLTGAAQSAQSAQTPSGCTAEPDCGADPWADSPQMPAKRGPQFRPAGEPAVNAGEEVGPSGPSGPQRELDLVPVPISAASDEVEVDGGDAHWGQA